MSTASARPASQSPAAAFVRWLPWILAAAALVPLLCNLAAFRTLFYFEDEMVLIDELDKGTFTSWTFRMFTESWVPLYKLVWGPLVLWSGNYFLQVVLLWLNHALNVALLAKLVGRIGGGVLAMAFAGVLLGLPAGNLETLGWVVQWTAVMSLTFFLLGLHLIARDAAAERPRPVLLGALLALLSLASAACFVRGILTGAVYAGVLLFSRTDRALWRRLLLSAVAVAPALAIIVVIFANGQGNHQRLGEHLAEKFQFGYTYFGQCPFRGMRGPDLAGSPWFHLLVAAKLGLYAAGLYLAPRQWRAVVLAGLLYELGNAVLLGIGRFHTGLAAASSSRYQYTALLTLAPSAGLVAEWLFTRLLRAPRVRLAVGTAAAIALGAFVAWPWAREMESWKGWRGGDFRAGLAAPPESAPPNFSRLGYMDNDHARRLVKKYNLR